MNRRIALLCCAFLMMVLPTLIQPPATAAQVQTCCTAQDWTECYSNVPQGCYVEIFSCFHWRCFCGYFCV